MRPSSEASAAVDMVAAALYTSSQRVGPLSRYTSRIPPLMKNEEKKKRPPFSLTFTRIIALAKPETTKLVIATFFLLIAVQGVAMAIRYYLFMTVGERVVTRLRARLFQSLVSQEIGFFDGQKTGDLTSRLSSDTTVLQTAVSGNISMGLRSLTLAAGT